MKEASVEEVSTIGLDIAKSVFQAHGADAAGHQLCRRRMMGAVRRMRTNLRFAHFDL
jgi:transposase